MGVKTGLACAAADVAHWGLTSVLKRGGGNVPGTLALKLDPQIIADLAPALEGSIVVTGTNGKTTTNGLIADGLAAAGYDVVCNRAGNNMQTGIAAAIVAGRRGSRGTGAGAAGAGAAAGKKRFGAFECDELYTVRVLPQLKPRALVLLNLFRDQLDRYGEIDHTQDVIAQALEKSPTTTLIYNADDPLCAAIADRVPNSSIGFGIDEPTGLEADRISDSRFCAKCNAPLDYDYVHYGQLGKYRCPKCGWERPELAYAARNVALECGRDGGYSWDICGADGFSQHVKTRYNGLYMVFNVTAVAAALQFAGADTEKLDQVIADYEPAGGRMHTYHVLGRDVVSNLAKNPAGFDRMISEVKAADSCLMAFFLNDNDADGHDISWIWDVDFEKLCELDLERVFVGGTRKNDLQVRLKYAGIDARLIDGIEDAVRGCFGADDALELHSVANYTVFPTVTADLKRLDGTERPAGSADVAAGCARVELGCVADAGLAGAIARPLRIVHLYPDALNLYGDGGNIASLRQRCEWRGIPVVVDQVRMGEELDLSDADVVLLGGGADRDQLAVCKELLAQKEKLAAYVESDGALLAICGGYQLLGRFYMMGNTQVEGLGVIGAETRSGEGRLIHNVAINSPVACTPIVGFENHGGRTYLDDGETPLGTPLVAGTGNNEFAVGEGVLHKGVVGTYFHGPVLPKNPQVTDWLIAHALERRGIACELPALDDAYETAAHDVALDIVRG
ncbi:MurT ligase domain-containing protein [Paratractidigestivibacter sp.]|uniref:MurT ligase domain-containing protein n=2 Tax=Paratractidigestivibacter sp. TaxID=2847316 RepID=UPI002ABE4595|nr:MurT ligase domain-containing protein [Paratractidigestivibacter sp.]